MCMWHLCAERVPSEHGTDGRSGRREGGAAVCKSQANCRMGIAHPTAHPQHLCRSERETFGGICVDGQLICAASCPATLFHSAVEQFCWEQNSQAAR